MQYCALSAVIVVPHLSPQLVVEVFHSRARGGDSSLKLTNTSTEPNLVQNLFKIADTETSTNPSTAPPAFPGGLHAL